MVCKVRVVKSFTECWLLLQWDLGGQRSQTFAVLWWETFLTVGPTSCPQISVNFNSFMRSLWVDHVSISGCSCYTQHCLLFLVNLWNVAGVCFFPPSIPQLSWSFAASLLHASNSEHFQKHIYKLHLYCFTVKYMLGKNVILLTVLCLCLRKHFFCNWICTVKLRLREMLNAKLLWCVLPCRRFEACVEWSRKMSEAHIEARAEFGCGDLRSHRTLGQPYPWRIQPFWKCSARNTIP